MPQHYPFTAIVGCAPEALEPMGLSLVLTTISPEIGGVLVRGQKGTAKSTAVRALAEVLPRIEVYAADRFSIDPDDPQASSPDGPFAADAERVTRPVRLVELPVGATEDRVLGSLHLQSALAAGQVEYEPGLLARAHRGILYVDEVNLLHDHLVDLLLDAAAMGRSTVERDGISVSHQARFVLIGTMNPEEGELRPQLLDRFGLTVEVAAPTDRGQRAAVVRRRMAYDADPAGFIAGYQAGDEALSHRIEQAQRRLHRVRLGDAALLKIAEVCAAFEVDGLRADIVTARTAIAHAAWCGRDEVTREDIRQAALLALPHRRRRNPFDAPGMDEELLDRILGDDELPPDDPDSGPDEPTDPEPTDPEASEDDQAGGQGKGDEGDGQQPDAPDSPLDDPSDASTPQDPSPRDDSRDEAEADDVPERPVVPVPPRMPDLPGTVHKAGTPASRPKLLTVRGVGEGAAGRRSRAITTDGRRVGARRPETGPGSLHLLETLRAAALEQPARREPPEAQGSPTPRLEIRAEDLRLARREGREANLVLFCVDASGSVAARKRMVQVKTAILSLLLDAYRRRDKVGLVTFRGSDAELALPPTRSVDIAAARLDEVPAGGRTPLAEGLMESAKVLRREHLRDPRMRPLLVVVTDGRATAGPDARPRALQAADHLASMGIHSVVVDVESGPMRLGLAARLAEHLGAEHLPLAQVTADALTSTVRTRTQPDERHAAAVG